MRHGAFFAPAPRLAGRPTGAQVFEASQELTAISPIVNVYRGETFAAKKAECVRARVLPPLRPTTPPPRRFLGTTLPGRLRNLSALLGDQQFFTGDTPYYCDYGVYSVLTNVLAIHPTAFAPYPNMAGFMCAAPPHRRRPAATLTPGAQGSGRGVRRRRAACCPQAPTAAVRSVAGVSDYLKGRPEPIDIGVKPMLRDK